MTGASSVFFDTSVLLPALIDMGSSHEAAQRLWDALAAGRLKRASTAWHCCLEFFAVATRLPEELRLSPEDAHVLLTEEVLARLDVFDLPAAERAPFLEEVAKTRILGGRVNDAHIASVAQRAGAGVIVTENTRDFVRFSSERLRVMTAAGLCRELLG